jgi:hypothetical protein
MEAPAPVLAPPEGFEAVDVPHLLLVRAVDAYNHMKGANAQANFVNNNHPRGPGGWNERLGADAVYWARARQAEGAYYDAVAAIAHAVGVDDAWRDLLLEPQYEKRPRGGRVVAYQVFRRIGAPAAAVRDEPPMPIVRMAIPNSLPETTEPSLLSIEGSSSGSSASQGLSGGQIAGIAVGSVAAVSLIVAAIIYWRRRRNSSKSSCPTEPRLV